MTAIYGLAKADTFVRMQAIGQPILLHSIDLIDRYSLSNTSRAAPIPWSEYQALRDAIHRNPAYCRVGKYEI